MEYINPETLQNGNVLLYLKHSFIEKKSGEAMLPLLCCLRDSQVIVPMNAIISDEDINSLMGAKKGDILTNKNDIRLKPDILQNGKQFLFPMFSNEGEMPEDYASRFSSINMNVVDCIKMAKSYKKVSGIVLDAFTDPVILPYSIADMILEIESRLPSQSSDTNK